MLVERWLGMGIRSRNRLRMYMQGDCFRAWSVTFTPGAKATEVLGEEEETEEASSGSFLISEDPIATSRAVFVFRYETGIWRNVV